MKQSKRKLCAERRMEYFKVKARVLLHFVQSAARLSVSSADIALVDRCLYRSCWLTVRATSETVKKKKKKEKCALECIISFTFSKSVIGGGTSISGLNMLCLKNFRQKTWNEQGKFTVLPLVSSLINASHLLRCGCCLQSLKFDRKTSQLHEKSWLVPNLANNFYFKPIHNWSGKFFVHCGG